MSELSILALVLLEDLRACFKRKLREDESYAAIELEQVGLAECYGPGRRWCHITNAGLERCGS